MGVASALFDGCVEAPDAVATGHTMRQTMGHQPIECAVQRHPIVRNAGSGECRTDLLVRQRLTGATQRVEDGGTRARDSPATRGNPLRTAGSDD